MTSPRDRDYDWFNYFRNRVGHCSRGYLGIRLFKTDINRKIKLINSAPSAV